MSSRLFIRIELPPCAILVSFDFWPIFWRSIWLKSKYDTKLGTIHFKLFGHNQVTTVHRGRFIHWTHLVPWFTVNRSFNRGLLIQRDHKSDQTRWFWELTDLEYAVTLEVLEYYQCVFWDFIWHPCILKWYDR